VRQAIPEKASEEIVEREQGGPTMADLRTWSERTTQAGERRRCLVVTRVVQRTAGNSAGFTFIEIMVVVAILAILAALVVPRIMGRTDDAKRTAAKVQIRNIEGALQLYKLDNGVYPTTEQGLKALIEKPAVGVVPKKWKIGGYLPKLPEDPWANPYKYLSPVQRGDQRIDYEITSLGTDGEVGGEGVNADITNWNLDKE
jgi:general secretion pathway protein G